MSLTGCPDWRRLSFVNAESCANCGLLFMPGSIQRKSDREERTFQNGALATFSLLILALVVVLILGELGFFGG
jgi:hypothetical protein